MQNLWRESFEWDDLPVWRKVLIVSLFAMFFVEGYQPFGKEIDIYTTAPSKPVPETRQEVPVHVNHGYLRYVTEKAAEDYRWWNDMTPVFIGATILGMVGTVVTYREVKK